MTRPVDRNAERQDPQGLGPKDESDGALKAQAASIPYLAVGERQAIAEAREIYVRWSDDRQHIRKWDFKPFDGGTRFLATPTTNAPVAETWDGLDIAGEARSLLVAEFPGDDPMDDAGLVAAGAIRALEKLLALSLTKNVATNADMRGALSNFLKWADRVQTGSAGVDYLNGDDGTGQDGWEDLDALREGARTVLQGDQS